MLDPFKEMSPVWLYSNCANLFGAVGALPNAWRNVRNPIVVCL